MGHGQTPVGNGEHWLFTPIQVHCSCGRAGGGLPGATLLRLADREGVRAKGGVELPFHLTRQSLADMSGTTVESAIRVVSRWLRDGLRGGRLVIRDRDGLRELAEGES